MAHERLELVQQAKKRRVSIINNKITVVDSMCGTGKSSALIDYIKDNTHKSFIYITPYLDEVARVKESLSGIVEFKDPVNKGDGKLGSLKKILVKGESIATTHMLFSFFDDEVLELIKLYEYTLILDEVADVVKALKIASADVRSLIESKFIKIEEDGTVVYNEESKYLDDKNVRFADVMHLARRKRLISYGENKDFLLWYFPIEVFMAFKESFILTYLFDMQTQAYYFKMNNVVYETKSAKFVDGKYRIVDFYKSDVSKLKTLINIHIDEGVSRLNVVGNDEYSLSNNWYKKQKPSVKKAISDNTRTWFKYRLKVKADDVLWTCFKIEDKENKKPFITVKDYSKRWIGCSTRATNMYQNVSCCAYLINRFVHPVVYNFFSFRGYEINENGMALSEIIQFIFRTKLRNGEPIDLYIPSRRMRMILENFLDELPLDDGFEEIFKFNMYKKQS
ncbi:MAG: hypothetical protein ACRDDY_04250 [Clostridium sp.]